MADFDAGSIKGSLELNSSAFAEGLRKARADAEEFERKPIVAKLDLDTSEYTRKRDELKVEQDAMSQDTRASVNLDISGALAKIATVKLAMAGLADSRGVNVGTTGGIGPAAKKADAENATQDVIKAVERLTGSRRLSRGGGGGYTASGFGDGSNAPAAIAKAEQKAKNAAGGGGGGGGGGGIMGGAMMPAVGGLGIGTLSLVPGLIPTLVAATAGLAVFAGAATLAAGVVMVSAKGYESLVKGDLAALKAHPDEFGAIGRQTTASIKNLSATTTSVQKQTAPGVLSVVGSGANLAADVLPKLVPIINTISAGLMGILADIRRLADSQLFAGFLASVQSFMQGFLKGAGPELTTLVSTLMTLFMGLRPVMSGLGSDITKWTTDLSDWITKISTNGDLVKWADGTQGALSQLLTPIWDILKGLYDISLAVAPVRAPFLEFISALAEAIAHLDWSDLARGLGSFFTALTGLLPPLSALVNTLMPVFAAAFKDASVILGGLAIVITPVANFLSFLVTHVPGATQVLGALVVAFGLYKLALIGTTAASVSAALGEAAMAVALTGEAIAAGAAGDAMAGLSLIMAATPWGAVAVAAGLAVAAVAIFGKAIFGTKQPMYDVTQLQDNLNNSYAKAKGLAGDLANATADYSNALGLVNGHLEIANKLQAQKDALAMVTPADLALLKQYGIGLGDYVDALAGDAGATKKVNDQFATLEANTATTAMGFQKTAQSAIDALSALGKYTGPLAMLAKEGALYNNGGAAAGEASMTKDGMATGASLNSPEVTAARAKLAGDMAVKGGVSDAQARADVQALADAYTAVSVAATNASHAEGVNNKTLGQLQSAVSASAAAQNHLKDSTMETSLVTGNALGSMGAAGIRLRDNWQTLTGTISGGNEDVTTMVNNFAAAGLTIDQAKTALNLLHAPLALTNNVMGVLNGQAAAAGGSVKTFVANVAQMKDPPPVNISVNTDGATAHLNSWLGQIGRMVATVQVKVNTVNPSFPLPPSAKWTGGRIEAHAYGGSMMGSTTLVGERGAELAELPQGTKITPASQTRQTLSDLSAASTAPFNQMVSLLAYIAANTGAPKDMVDALSQAFANAQTTSQRAATAAVRSGAGSTGGN